MVDYIGWGGIVIAAACVGVLLVAVVFEFFATIKEAKKRLDR